MKDRKRKEKIGHVARGILAALAMGGLVLVAASAPNALQLLKPLLKKQKRKFHDRSLRRSLKKLGDNRLVEFRMENGKEVLSITEEGKKRIVMLDAVDDRLKLTPPHHWDKKWTVIMYDIPEEQKRARDEFHSQLKRIGCFQYHKSVFVHPSDCRDIIDYLSHLFEIQRYVLHFITPSLGKNEYIVRRHFNL